MYMKKRKIEKRSNFCYFNNLHILNKIYTFVHIYVKKKKYSSII